MLMTTTDDLTAMHVADGLATAKDRLRNAEAALERMRADLKAAQDAEGAAMEAIDVYKVEVSAIIESQRQPGEGLLLSDAHWRATHPKAAEALNTLAGLQAERAAASGTVTRLSKDIFDMEWSAAPDKLMRLRGDVTRYEELAAQHAVQQAAAEAAREAGVKPTLADLTWRILGRR